MNIVSAMKFMSSLMNTTRNDFVKSTKWTYAFYFEVPLLLHRYNFCIIINFAQKTSVCKIAINHTTVQVCLNSSCTGTNGTVSMLPDGERRVMATFSDLMENRKYTATLNIHYNGGVVQQSQQLEISE